MFTCKEKFIKVVYIGGSLNSDKMVFGFNEARPSERDYSGFLSVFSKYIIDNGLHDVNLTLYGSYVRRTHIVGRSDIDGLLIFPGGTVIDKSKFNTVSNAVATGLKEHKIPLQFCVSDLRTMADGRFNVFDHTFESYLKDKRRVIFGPDYFSNFRFSYNENAIEERVKHNLKKCRNGLLFSRYFMDTDKKEFITRFNKCLDSVSSSAKSILWLCDNKIREERFSTVEEIERMFPCFDTRVLKIIRRLYTNLGELDNLYKDNQAVINLWNDSVEFLENLVEEYISSHPISIKQD